ncbi:elongation factor P-like protein YeiP [bacterium]|nr:elongation factor P-like protein YeiP [bacterium]
MTRASELKRNNVVRINGQIYSIVQIDVKTPSARGSATLHKIRFSHVQTGQKLEQTFRSEDAVDEVELEKKPVQFLYRDGESCTFMASDDYSQHTLQKEQLEGRIEWLSDGMEGITGFFLDSAMIGIEIPHTVNLEIAETAPALKGASVTNRSKPARLSNGVEIQVPEYMAVGDMVVVNTETGKFISRA